MEQLIILWFILKKMDFKRISSYPPAISMDSMLLKLQTCLHLLFFSWESLVKPEFKDILMEKYLTFLPFSSKMEG